MPGAKKIASFQNYKVKASTMNAMIDAAQAEKGRLFGGGNAGESSADERAGVILVRNDTGGDLDVFDVVAIDALLTDPDVGEDHRSYVHSVLTPAAGYETKFGVLQVPIKTGDCGKCMVVGISPVYIVRTLGDTSNVVGITPGQNYLTTGSAGAQILNEDTTGDQTQPHAALVAMPSAGGGGQNTFDEADACATAQTAVDGSVTTVDGVTLAAGMVVFLTAQTDATQNGLWNIPTGGGAWVKHSGLGGGGGAPGPQGQTGSTGATGAPGSPGATGATGAPGSTGATGAPGAPGSTGATGAAGAAGSVWRDGAGAPSSGLGVNGDYYLNDTTGDVYLKASGAYSIVANIKGATGSTGATGGTGAPGATGAAGAAGSVWRDGSGVPSNALGINGDYYLNDATGDVYFKASGAYTIVANIKGAAGATGLTGATGASTTWRDGAGAPSSGLGVNGDYYLNDTTGDVYLKASGAYSIVANIKGATGATGPAGANGGKRWQRIFGV
jgi:hypothetical protein